MLEFFKAQGTKGFLATLNYHLALAEEALGEPPSDMPKMPSIGALGDETRLCRGESVGREA